jgi:SpoVK/Ycf46/Vps4 family AAA+-type ATPase
MSHFTDIDIEIRDLEALKAACAELGLPVAQNELARGYGESLHRGEYVIRLKGPYDIAVTHGSDGRWTHSLKKGSLLEIVETQATLADVGGLDALKQWLLRRRSAFTVEAAEYGLPPPKGLLLLGIPGTGKSLAAKATASVLGKPLLRLDVGRLFGGVVGESEANLRRAIAMAEAAAPCVLQIDEIEKALSGSRSSGQTDGGTGARVFGSFLSWLQDKTAPVFVVATANDVSQLPPELLRKGRLDEIFFVDLPGDAERAEIWRIHIAKRKRDPAVFDIPALVCQSSGFTGSEIEQAFIDALYAAYETRREVSQQDVCESLRRTVPLSVTMAEDIRALRQWAEKRTRSAAGDAAEEQTARRIAV